VINIHATECMRVIFIQAKQLGRDNKIIASVTNTGENMVFDRPYDNYVSSPVTLNCSIITST
jgi:hypothetical protein